MSMSYLGRRRGFRLSFSRVLLNVGATAIATAIGLAQATPLMAQGGEATPVRANLVTPTPEVAQPLAPTITPSHTPTPLPAARLQALRTAGNVNVRALPDIESDLLGTIAHGRVYPVLRNYYRWYELGFDLSPNGRAWVYGDLVTIEGDAAQIEVIETLDQVILPGGTTDSLTGDQNSEVDARPRSIDIATVEADAARAVEVVDATLLPTFTPPATQPPFVQQLEITEPGSPSRQDLPPIVPILALAGLGVAGLIIGLLRR